MGQKVNPNGFRLGVSKKQNANWYAKGKDFSNNLIQDLKVRDHLNSKLKNSSISKIELERTATKARMKIAPSREVRWGGKYKSKKDIQGKPKQWSTTFTGRTNMVSGKSF